MVTPEDTKSLEAARGIASEHDAARVRVERRLSPEAEASLKLVGLEDWELDLCHAWAGLHTPPGVSEECRYAKYVLEKVPIPPKADILDQGILDKQRFWDQMGLGEHLDFFWQARHSLDRSMEPRTALGRIALKVIRHWRAFAEANWPTAADMYWAVKRKGAQGTKRRRLKEPETKVGLAELWRLTLHLERVWHGRGQRSTINPEDIYEALGDLQDQVEVNCWSRDDETMLELMKKASGGLDGGCSFCDIYSLDTFEFGWGGRGTCCPRCSTRLMDPDPAQAPKWDGGPTAPGKGEYAYRWAVKHGYMWDEFQQEVRGLQTGFDPAKKVLCPLLAQCNTRCAQDQKDGVRGWPLGSSDYETSCYRFRQIFWSRQTGGTPEQFDAVEHARLEGVAKARNTAERRPRQPKQVATPTTKGPTKVVPPEPNVQRPRLF